MSAVLILLLLMVSAAFGVLCIAIVRWFQEQLS